MQLVQGSMELERMYYRVERLFPEMAPTEILDMARNILKFKWEVEEDW